MSNGNRIPRGCSRSAFVSLPRIAAVCWQKSRPRSRLADIQKVSMDDDRGIYTMLNFTLQVTHRVHLARIMRGLRHIPEVLRITRTKE